MASNTILSLSLIFLILHLASTVVLAQDYDYPSNRMGMSAYGNVYCSPSGNYPGGGVPNVVVNLNCYIDGDNFYTFGHSTTDSSGFFNITLSGADLQTADPFTACYVFFDIPTSNGNCPDFSSSSYAHIWSFLQSEGTTNTAMYGMVEKQRVQNWVKLEAASPGQAPADSPVVSASPATPVESPTVSPSPTQVPVEPPTVSLSPSPTQTPVESPTVSPSPTQVPVEPPTVSLSPSPVQAPAPSPVVSSSPTPAPAVSSSPTPAPAKAISKRPGISAYGNVYCSSTGNRPGKRAAGLDVKLNCTIDSTKSLTIGHTSTNSAGFFNITLPGSDLTAFRLKPKCYVYFNVPTKAGNCAKFHSGAKSLIRSDIQAVRTELTAAYGLVLREKAKRWYIVKSK